ncbi:unnamed protein product [Rotaria sp. Silwood1]|nr:unnamed protein product [Rotaria sp. Silwood1]CAF0943561.1 unnamed protein product [Rotaria sp. Silwood1]CAF3394915.1 unnamed protein product [Rotaria sp. Silwood1]CAF4494043.1 unnamed protein product [Rotaria sp. Silwood1]CAF4566085.1 unnamed protein product [Rotaria sp. Silwood1]
MSTLHKRLARKHHNGSKKENRPNTKQQEQEQEQEHHQSIFLDLSDQSRALYYLGLTYHLKAKELLYSTGGVLNENIRTLLNKSIVYYEQNLDLNKELNDKVAEGRTLGNIGNVNYLLQDYSTSIEYLDKRLTIAKECNDRAGERRAHGNLGNAYLYLEDFDKALHHYREAMNIGEIMNDESFMARMNFTIGRVYCLKHDYETAIYFHEKHLNFARQLEDSIGQCRAYYVLSQLNEKINQYDKAKKYESLYKALAREINEPTEDNISMSTKSGPTNILLNNLRTDSSSLNLSEGAGTNNGSSASSSHSPYSAHSNASVNSSVTDVRSYTGSHTIGRNDKSISNKSKKNKLNSYSLKTNLMHHLGKKSPSTPRKESLPADHDELVELVCRMQKSRFEDQRCDLKTTTHETTNSIRGHRPSAQLEDILNTVDRLQRFRLNDQRTNLPSAINHDNNNNNTSTTNESLSQLNEQFFDQLAKCQDSRLDDQRAVLVPIHNHNASNDNSSTRPTSASTITSSSSITTTADIELLSKDSSNESTSKTLPDDDFFSLLNRLQSRRIDQQRTCLPSTINANSPLTSPTSSSTPSKRTRVKQ